ncbi:hypothetical protein AgCh_023288 [Apium graveolens]
MFLSLDHQPKTFKSTLELVPSTYDPNYKTPICSNNYPMFLSLDHQPKTFKSTLELVPSTYDPNYKYDLKSLTLALFGIAVKNCCAVRKSAAEKSAVVKIR